MGETFPEEDSVGIVQSDDRFVFPQSLPNIVRQRGVKTSLTIKGVLLASSPFMKDVSVNVESQCSLRAARCW